MLEIRNVTKCYGRAGRTVAALRGVSASVAPGEFLAVQGPSGSGKTTLLLMAGALLAPDAGEILIDGQDAYALSAERRCGLRAKAVGFVFQQFHLVPYLTVQENVLAPSLASASAAPAERAAALIDRFALADRADHLPGQLSTGERQRVALARAMLNAPKLLLADEPTGNLDTRNADTVLAALAEFARDGGAVLMVTHSPQAAGYAQRVLHLADGRLGESRERSGS